MTGHLMPARGDWRRMPTDGVIWIRPHHLRIRSYGELGEAERRRKWLIRRWTAAVLFLVLSYPIGSGPVQAWVRHSQSDLAARLAPYVKLWYRPLNYVRRVPLYDAYQQVCDYAAARLLTPSAPPPPQLTLGGAAALALGAYVISPVLLWLLMRFLAIDEVPFVRTVFDFVYAPLSWAADRSRIAWDFFTHYFEAAEQLE